MNETTYAGIACGLFLAWQVWVLIRDVRKAKAEAREAIAAAHVRRAAAIAEARARAAASIERSEET